MAHSNKPQADICDGPYFQECEAAAEMSEEARYWEEVSFWENAAYDRYDGWREDFSREGLDDEAEAEAAAAAGLLAPPPPPRPVVIPQPLSDDDILF